MKTLNFTTTLIALMASFFSEAKYVDNFYLGMGFNTTNYQVNNPIHHFEGNLNSLHFMSGVTINSYLALEGRYGLGLFKDKYTVDDHNIKAKLSSVYGLYAKGSLGMFDIITPYALIGYTRSSMNTDSNVSGKHANKESDFSYGAGLEFNIFPLILNLEYIKYLETDEYELSGFNINFYTTF